MRFTRLASLRPALSRLLLGVLVSLAAGPQARAAIATGVDPSAYPSADPKEWGQLRWVLRLAEQPLDDFTDFQSVDEIGDSAKRYEIAFAGYLLGVEQFHKFPAWQGPLQVAYDRLIRKMLEKPVWEYWARDSAGRPIYEPGMNSPEAPSADPVGYRNIMFSGHLGMMIGQYEMLYRDHKWDRPGSIVFQWDDHTRFTYDDRSLQRVMFLQMIENPVPGIECEPNAIFPACNQHPILSWKHHDQMHGTRYFAAAAPLFAAWFDTELIDPKTNVLAFAYLVKQGYTLSEWNPRLGNAIDPKLEAAVRTGKLSLDSAANDGWVGAFMHAWRPEQVKRIYPSMRRRFVETRPDGSETLRFDSVSPPDYFGFFTMLSAEMGDEELRRELLRTADEIYRPVWVDGTYHYPFHDTAAAAGTPAPALAEESSATPRVVKPMGSPDPACCGKAAQNSNLQDRLFALARALPPGGLWRMYEEPFDDRHFQEPAVTGVDVKRVSLRRAIYDRRAKALVVSTAGTEKGARSTFRIVNLDPGKRYLLAVTGEAPRALAGLAEVTVSVDTRVDRDVVLTER